MKDLNQELDLLLESVELPTEAELRRETKNKKIALKNTGSTKSEAARNKMKESKKGKTRAPRVAPSQETKNKISVTLKGRKLSSETCAKMKGRPATNNRYVKIGWTEKPFPSIKLAVEWAKDNGITNSRSNIFNFLKTDPTNFYYITLEQYNQATKNENS